MLINWFHANNIGKTPIVVLCKEMINKKVSGKYRYRFFTDHQISQFVLIVVICTVDRIL